MGWNYYNHALIPAEAPHKAAELAILNEKNVWKTIGKKALLARWIEEFDCGFETEWWYCIKDEPFDISKLKSKNRYVVNTGIKNFEVRAVDPKEHKEALSEVVIDSFSAYPKRYRPKIDKEKLIREISNWGKRSTIIAAFCAETGMLCGYAALLESDGYINFYALKVRPSFEKKQINAALVNGVLEHFSEKLENGVYISDGERNILHKTKFQDYLEKYFMFRKAYCKVRVMYRPSFGVIVKLLFPLRKIIKMFEFNSFISKICGIMALEEIVRKQEG